MKIAQLVIALLAVMGLCGCEWIVADTKNVGNPPGIVEVRVWVTNPSDVLLGGVNATWTADVSGTTPITIIWDFGGGADPNEVTDTTNNQSVITVTMVNPSTDDNTSYTGTATIIDATGNSASAAFHYTVGPTPNTPPVIDSATFAGSVLTVIAHDDDGDAMTAYITVPTGAAVDATGKDIIGSTATFTFSADSLVAGATGEVTVVANDGIDDSEPVTATLTIDPFIPEPDTLYALSTQGVVVILTGAIANPFQYLNGVGLTVDGDLDYEAGTFNVGAPGGGAGDCDGAWTGMNPSGGFLLPPDNFIVKTDIGGGRGRIDFNLTPIGGSDVIGMEGMLINFGLTGSYGTYTLGFQEFSGVDRTYYTDGATNIYHWGTLMADETGALAPGIDVDNTYTVN